MLEDLDIINIYKTFHSKIEEYTFSYQELTKHSPGQIKSQVTNQALVNFRKLKLYQAFFSDYKAMRLDINLRQKKKKKRKNYKHMENKQYL